MPASPFLFLRTIKIHCTFPSVQWIFSLFHPLAYPPYLIDIYLKLFFQIVFSVCKLISHWTIPLFFYIFRIKIKFLVVRPPFLLM